MLHPGKALKVSIYVSEGATRHGVSTSSAILDFLFYRGISGATVYRGILGYGAHRRAHADKPQHLSRDNSILLSVIDTQEKIEGFLPLIEQMVQEGLIVFSDVDIIKYAYRPPEQEP